MVLPLHRKHRSDEQHSRDYTSDRPAQPILDAPVAGDPGLEPPRNQVRSSACELELPKEWPELRAWMAGTSVAR